jgi:hypothetical protein
MYDLHPLHQHKLLNYLKLMWLLQHLHYLQMKNLHHLFLLLLHHLHLLLVSLFLQDYLEVD